MKTSGTCGICHEMKDIPFNPVGLGAAGSLSDILASGRVGGSSVTEEACKLGWSWFQTHDRYLAGLSVAAKFLDAS